MGKASREYKAWENMRSRCNNPKATGYKNYGGRGIEVCSRWDSFEFFKSDMGLIPGPGYSLDRIDVNGHYSPENCRWATKKQQMRNTRLNRIVNGMSLQDAAEHMGVHPKTLAGRVYNNIPLDLPITKPYGLSEASRETGIPINTLRNRMVRNGLTLQEAKRGIKK